MTVTAGNVPTPAAWGAALCALVPCKTPSLHNAMETTEIAKALGLAHVRNVLMRAARTATGRQNTFNDIAPASEFMNMNVGATCRGCLRRVNESTLESQ
ncbi:hypothetical protein LPJ38_22610 [Bradyrhizobium daqingense]|uniref:hypothetical protein n=1 Tax=Bradyrhizobium daqingense TaxID=993502 RepID=UPI0011A6844A|nr:hypothetical protein [Bradyrhizobium daqingense]UFS86464.1 hypothetical protein LPJ38_22610 [Bradyrhizobium daqingense]